VSLSSQSVSAKAKVVLVCIVALCNLCLPEVDASTAKLTWNRSPSTNVAGYHVYYGLTSGNYPYMLNAGNTPSATVSGLTPGQTYYYTVTAYSTTGQESGQANVVSNTTPAQILAQPLSQTAVIGTIAVLSANVASVVPVTFQWFFNGAAIDDATNSILILPGVSQGNAGSYKVVASNAGGNVTSTAAVLSVLDSVNVTGGSMKPIPSGTYNGLFYQTNSGGGSAVAPATTGSLSQCTVGANGAYSSKISLGGQTFSISGVFNGAGINTVVNRSFLGLSNLDLTLYADSVLGTGRLTGVVSNMDRVHPWVALLTANLAVNASPPAAFVFLSPPPPGQLQQSWTCQLVVGINGTVLLTGQLGDGTTILQSGSMGADGNFPVYQSLYNNTGVLAGWINLAGPAPIGNLTWIQSSNPLLSQNGFSTTISFGAGPGLSTNYFQPIQ
jgi:hypothetical protein